jgi:chemotaxis methyl-accepting protein methylase
VQNNIFYYSFLFREPELFAYLPDYLLEKYPQGANIVCYGASTGAEPYSIVMKLLEAMTPEQAARHFPVVAREQNPQLVEFAIREGALFLDTDDLQDYRQAGMKTPINRFLTRDRSQIKAGRYTVNPLLRDKVAFETADLVKDAASSTFPPGTVLFFRNAWYHLPSPLKAVRLCRQLFANLPPGSTLIVGRHLMERKGYACILRHVGFRQAEKSGPLSQVLERP